MNRDDVDVGSIQVWRVRRIGRFASVVLAVTFTAGGVASVVVGVVNGRLSIVVLSWPFAILLVAMGVSVYNSGVRAYIEARDDGLVVQNPFRCYWLTWPEIKKVTPGYSGIVIERHGSGRIQAWAVQKSNWASFRRKRTRADDGAEEIARRATATQCPRGQNTREPTPDEPPDLES